MVLIGLASLLLAVPAAGAAFRVRTFQIPGGNIACGIVTGNGSDGGSARCDIRHRSWRPPHKPRSCPLDYGNGLIVEARGRGKFTCAGDTLLGQGRVLRVGRVAGLGPYRCRSLGGAVRCVNRRTGHGFKISRRMARRF